LAVGESNSVNGVGVLMIQDENVVVSSTGRDGKFASLIGVGFERGSLRNKCGTYLMRTWFEFRCNVVVGRGADC
jgi:hypothetical protein